MADMNKFTVADRFGNDPLQHRILSNLDQVTRVFEHTVKESEVSNPQLIAHDHFNDVEMFIVILAFNGIPDGFSLEAGQVIQIPDPSQIRKLSSNNKQGTKVKI